MPTYINEFRDVQNFEDFIVRFNRYMDHFMSHLSHHNVKWLFTEYCDIRSEKGETIIQGPLLLMYDKQTPAVLRLQMGYDKTTDKFVFQMFDSSGNLNLSLNDLGEAVFAGNISTLKNAYIGNDLYMGSNDNVNKVIRMRTKDDFDAVIKAWTDVGPGLAVGMLGKNEASDAALNDLNDFYMQAINIYPASGGTSYFRGNWDFSRDDTNLTFKSGAFTPTIKGSSTAGNNTYGFQVGFYYLIGKMCFFDAQVQLSAKDAAMAGNISIDGLPFTAKNDTNRKVSCSISYIRNFTHDATKTLLTARIIENTAAISLLNNGDNTAPSSVTAAQINATTQLAISGAYEIA